MVNVTLLDFAGLALAVVFAVVVAFFGHASFLPLMLIFLAASVLVTKYGYGEKREMGLYEHERSWENVLANGIVPALCAVLYPVIGVGPYLGSLAAITADKFASEMGVLGGQPFSLLDFKRVKKGTSGAISFFGTLMSFDGALIIGAGFFVLVGGVSAWTVVKIALIGTIGSMGDSIVGVLEEKGVGNKSTTNAICAAIGALLGAAYL
ncbi:DUF92 domain-containing protein [Candidatus Micrarchaeota archaeon]|nr:DUF92 domain-containing protein [Candidatus Micrarchaeota archaeon]